MSEKVQPERYSVWRILKIQMNHFLTKDLLWRAVSWIQIYFYLSYAPELGKKVFTMLDDCSVPDVQNGVVHKYKI